MKTILILLLAAIAAMPCAAQDNSAGKDCGAAASCAFSLPHPGTAGDSVAVGVRVAALSPSLVISDAAGDVFMLVASQAQTADGHWLAVYCAKLATSGTISITAALPAPALIRAAATEMKSTCNTDQVVSAQGSSSAAATPMVNAGAGETVLAFASSSDTETFTPGNGFALAAAANKVAAAAATGAGQPLSPLISIARTENWAAIAASFKNPPPPRITLFGSASVSFSSVALDNANQFSVSATADLDLASLAAYPGCDQAAGCVGGVRICEAGNAARCIDLMTDSGAVDLTLLRRMAPANPAEAYPIGKALLTLPLVLGDFSTAAPAIAMTAKLTPREKQVLDLMIEGLQHKEIADRAGISERTVKHHAGQVFAKHGVQSRSELLRTLRAGNLSDPWKRLSAVEQAMCILCAADLPVAEILSRLKVKPAAYWHGIRLCRRILGVKGRVGLAMFLTNRGIDFQKEVQQQKFQEGR